MRGRTNAGGSGNLVIKGDVGQFKVEEGTRITAGDFVEYKKQKNVSILSYSDIGDGKKMQIGENLIAAISNKSLILLKMINGKLNIVASYNEKEVTGFCLIESGKLAVSVSTAPYLVKLQIENDIFVNTNTADWGETCPIVENEIVCGAEEIEGKIYLLSLLATASDSKRLACYIFDLSSDGGLVYSGVNILYPSFIRQTGNYIFYGTFSVGNLIVAYFQNGSSPPFKYLYTAKIDEENNQIVKGDICGDEKLGRDSFFYPIVFFDKYVVFSSDEYIYCCNSISNTSEKILSTSLGFSAADSYGEKIYMAISKCQEDKMAIFFHSSDETVNYQVCVFQVNSSGTITRASDIFELDIANSGSAINIFFAENTVNATIYSTGNPTNCYALSYNEISHWLTDYIDADYVRPYSGGEAMGVAKQSGTSGQKIEVYVPKL